ncbi:MAG: ribosome maturation factor RimP [Actinomycetota bacterium]|jgi:ribosome maturation factor RimP|nr:ribosome maturation factor RimP [Actinomycetota bacterium]MDQ1540054.1 ribosome maturation factor RimP [Actinomycetota bacterium]
MSSASAGSQLAALLAPVVEDTGLDLEAVAVTRQGRRSEVRVLVDKDGGVSLDDVALVSHAISSTLDLPVADAILGSAAYVLEVSSPGVERPLSEPRHWRRAVGRLVRVGLTSGDDVTGRIIAADADGVRLAVAGKKPGSTPSERHFGFDEIGPGRVQVEFNRAPSDDPDDDPHADLNAEESP